MARFLGDTGGFLTAMLARLDELKVDVSAMQMDHVTSTYINRMKNKYALTIIKLGVFSG